MTGNNPQEHGRETVCVCMCECVRVYVEEGGERNHKRRPQACCFDRGPPSVYVGRYRIAPNFRGTIFS